MRHGCIDPSNITYFVDFYQFSINHTDIRFISSSRFLYQCECDIMKKPSAVLLCCHGHKNARTHQSLKIARILRIWECFIVCAISDKYTWHPICTICHHIQRFILSYQAIWCVSQISLSSDHQYASTIIVQWIFLCRFNWYSINAKAVMSLNLFSHGTFAHVCYIIVVSV